MLRAGKGWDLQHPATPSLGAMSRRGLLWDLLHPATPSLGAMSRRLCSRARGVSLAAGRRDGGMLPTPDRLVDADGHEDDGEQQGAEDAAQQHCGGEGARQVKL